MEDEVLYDLCRPAAFGDLMWLYCIVTTFNDALKNAGTSFIYILMTCEFSRFLKGTVCISSVTPSLHNLIKFKMLW